jgi:hypothetical protein
MYAWIGGECLDLFQLIFSRSKTKITVILKTIVILANATLWRLKKFTVKLTVIPNMQLPKI